MKVVRLRMSLRQFHRLPRCPAYKYEYFGGRAVLTPRPKLYHALLDLRTFAPPPDGDRPPVRPVREDEWDDLAALFSAAFRDRPPLLGLDDAARRAAAREILEFTRTGGDGPLIPSACLVAECDRVGGAMGGLLTTLTPGGDLSAWGACLWPEPPAADVLERRLGRPHLTWVFVHPLAAGRGAGAALLAAAARELRTLGYDELASTFMLGNEASTLWHWRHGFTLAAAPWSMRRKTKSDPP
jgi:GNAT superfamily N-acetyltransferase